MMKKSVIIILILGLFSNLYAVGVSRAHNSGIISSRFTPKRISSLIFWLDATDLSSITKDGSNLVSAWKDLSGNNNNTTSSAKPTYVASAINSKPALRFNNAQYLTTGTRSSLDVSATAGFTQIVVIKPTLADANFHGILGTDSPYYRYPSIWCYNTTVLHYGFGDGVSWSNATTTQKNTITNNSEQIVMIKYNSSSKEYWAYVNGVLQYKYTAPGTPYNAQTLDIGKVDNYFVGDIAEVIIFNKPISVAESLLIHKYLSSKWAITYYEDKDSDGIRDDLDTYPNDSTNNAAANFSTNGLKLWFDANNAGSVVTNGSSVLGWVDASGQNNRVAQVTNSPTYVTGVQNGKPVVRFNGASGTFLQGSFLSTLSNSGGLTFIALVKDSGTTSDVGGVIAGDGYCGVFSNLGARYIVDGAGGGTGNSANSISSINSFKIITGIYTQASTTNSYMYVNGALEENWTGSGVGINAFNNFQVGGRTWDNNAYPTRVLNGDIAEILVYNRVITESERAVIHQYLAAKWGLAANTLDCDGDGMLDTVDPYPYDHYNNAANMGLSTSGLVLWLNSNINPGETFSNGSAISRWQDMSGNNLSALQSNASLKPTYSTVPSAGLNYHSAIAFNGFSQYLQFDSSSIDKMNPSNYTLFLVVQVNGGQGTYRSPFTSRGNITGYNIYADNTNTWQHWIGNGSGWITPGISSVVVNQAIRITATTSSGAVYLKTSTSSGMEASSLGTLSRNTVYAARIGVGATETTPTYYFNGVIGEIILYNRVLSYGEITNIETALYNRWLNSAQW